MIVSFSIFKKKGEREITLIEDNQGETETDQVLIWAETKALLKGEQGMR